MADLNSLEREILELRDRVAQLERLLGHKEKIPTPSKPIPQPQPVPTPYAAPPFVPKKARINLEKSIGVRWFNIVGAVAIILGIGYFLQYAIENDWIGPVGRVSLGLLSGIGVLVWGDIIRAGNRYRVMSLGMAGVGISALYLSFFAAFSFYNLLPQSVAFLCMLATTAVAIFMAVRYNSLTIALIAMFGGFITPALLSTGENKPIGLFSYLLILNAGVLVLAFKKNWKLLNVFCMLFTYFWYIAWYAEYYSNSQMTVGFVFLSLFFFTFSLLAFVYNILHHQKTGVPDILIILMNALFYFPLLLGVLHRYDNLYGFFALALSAFYLFLGALAYRRSKEDTYLLYSLLSVAATSLVVAVPLQFDGPWIPVAWAAEALGLWYIGLKSKSTGTLVASFLIFVVSITTLPVVNFMHSFFDPVTNRYQFALFFNKPFLSGAFVMAALFAAAYLARKFAPGPGGFHVVGGRILSVAAAIGLLILLSVDVDHSFSTSYANQQSEAVRLYEQNPELAGTLPPIEYFGDESRFILSGLWALYSMALISIGFYRKNTPIRILAMVIFGCTIIKVAWDSFVYLDGFFRIASLLGLGVVLFIVSYLYQKYKGIFDESATAS